MSSPKSTGRAWARAKCELLSTARSVCAKAGEGASEAGRQLAMDSLLEAGRRERLAHDAVLSAAKAAWDGVVKAADADARAEQMECARMELRDLLRGLEDDGQGADLGG